MLMARTFLAATLVMAAVAWADEAPKLKGSMKKEAPKLDLGLGLPKFGDIPKGEALQKAKPQEADTATRSSPDKKDCSVVSVQHAKGFLRSPQGSKPSAPMPTLVATGSPLRTDKFITMVRVKCEDKRTREIAVAILDPGGDTLMDASGSVGFPGGVENDWQVDWEATSVRRPGTYQVLVRLGGEPLGTFPLQIEAKAEPEPAKTK